MPDAAPPVNRFRRGCSRSNDSLRLRHRPYAFDTSSVVPLRSFFCSHLIGSFPDLLLPCSRPCLLSTAAEGSLEPAPASRFRGVFPHRSSSYTYWALLGPFLSWRTIIGVAHQFEIGRLPRLADYKTRPRTSVNTGLPTTAKLSALWRTLVGRPHLLPPSRPTTAPPATSGSTASGPRPERDGLPEVESADRTEIAFHVRVVYSLITGPQMTTNSLQRLVG
jgi:hypothetical protein